MVINVDYMWKKFWLVWKKGMVYMIILHKIYHNFGLMILNLSKLRKLSVIWFYASISQNRFQLADITGFEVILKK